MYTTESATEIATEPVGSPGSRERAVSYLEVGGQKLRVAVRRSAHAAGPPLLVFNGIGASLELLDDLLDAMPSIETVVFDIPGVGGSGPPRGPRRLAGFSRLARSLLAELGLEQVDVLGVSWGGGLAQQFAYQYPRLCRRLVLAATSTGHLMVPGNPLTLLRMATPARYFSDAYFRRVAGSVYGGDFRRDPELVRRHSKLMSPPSIRGYLSQMYAFYGWTSLHFLARLRQPTLILAGEDDPIIPPINARILARRIPDATLHWLDCGHLFLLTRRQESARHIEGFLLEAR